MVWIHSPEGRQSPAATQLASMPKPGSAPISIALFDNRKANAAGLLAELGSRLEERLGASIHHYTKPNASVAAAPALLDQIATEANFAVAASSD
ncbi:MAG: hypothetical protein GY910_05600 [bacterium]|nr:hypothetical protein [Deltaproteobacteria bacterium]MCP4904435.1 hypothetical protein [bacterium]